MGPGNTGGDRRGVHAWVVEELGLAIVTRRRREGERISVDDACREFSASRTAVREALRVLEAKGMVRARPKIGTIVLPAQSWDLLDEDVIGWRVRGPDRLRQLGELMDLRVAVEVEAIGACCTHATPDDVRALKADCQRMRMAGEAGDLAAFTAADVSFHARILTSSGSLIYAQFVQPFRAVLRARHDLATLPDRIDEEAMRAHADIAEAIEQRSTKLARDHARRLIESSRTELFSALQLGP